MAIDSSLALYVHWPFCVSKCPYCDFNSHVRESVDHAAWRDAMLADLRHEAGQLPGRKLGSIFFGGGTPSLMEPATVAAVIDRAAARWPLAADVEITLEANPTSVEAERFRGFRAAGVNRVSLGVQALDDRDLARLGREHSAAEALAAVQHELAARGLGLKVFDGYRPYRVTEAMWEPIQNPDFVADPKEGSKHNRGCAVDLTIVDAKTGADISMPTPYDDFTPRAGYAFADLPADVLEHRALLRGVLERHGFEAIDSEWWHFDYQDWRSYRIGNQTFEQLGTR